MNKHNLGGMNRRSFLAGGTAAASVVLGGDLTKTWAAKTD